MWVRGQGFEVLRDGLEMGNLCQHGHLLILKASSTCKAETHKPIVFYPVIVTERSYGKQNKSLPLFYSPLLAAARLQNSKIFVSPQ